MDMDRLPATLLTFVAGIFAGALLAMMDGTAEASTVTLTESGRSESLYATCLPYHPDSCVVATEQHHVWHYEAGYMDAEHDFNPRPLTDFEPHEIENVQAAIISYVNGYVDSQVGSGYNPVLEP